MKKRNKIVISKSKRGTFTQAAKRAGMSVQAFAKKVLANKHDYSSAMVKKANFARNAAKWNKQEGGILPKNNNVPLNNINIKPTISNSKINNPMWGNMTSPFIDHIPKKNYKPGSFSTSFKYKPSKSLLFSGKFDPNIKSGQMNSKGGLGIGYKGFNANLNTDFKGSNYLDLGYANPKYGKLKYSTDFDKKHNIEAYLKHKNFSADFDTDFDKYNIGLGAGPFRAKFSNTSKNDKNLELDFNSKNKYFDLNARYNSDLKEKDGRHKFNIGTTVPAGPITLKGNVDTNFNDYTNITGGADIKFNDGKFILSPEIISDLKNKHKIKLAAKIAVNKNLLITPKFTIDSNQNNPRYSVGTGVEWNPNSMLNISGDINYDNIAGVTGNIAAKANLNRRNSKLSDGQIKAIEALKRHQDGSYILQNKTDSLINEYPLLKKYGPYNVKKVDKDSPYGGMVGYIPAGEKDPQGNVINPSDTTLIELYKGSENYSDNEQLDLIKGDLLHSLTKDAKWKTLVDQVWENRDEGQKRMDKNAYDGRNGIYARDKDGNLIEGKGGRLLKIGEKSPDDPGYDDRPFNKWADVSRKDMYVRGYMMKYPNMKNVYNEKQLEILNSMESYLGNQNPNFHHLGNTTTHKVDNKRKGGSLPKAQEGEVLTYQNNPEYFDNKAALHSNLQYSDLARTKIYEGTHGYNPTTGVLTKLDSPQGGATGLDLAYSKREEDRTSQDKRQVQHAKTFKDLQNLYKNPLFYAPAAVATVGALGPAIGAGVTKTLANPYVQAGLTGLGVYDATTHSIPGAFKATKEGRYLDAAGNTAMASLDLLPIPFFGTNLIGEGKRLGKALTKTPTPVIPKNVTPAVPPAAIPSQPITPWQRQELPGLHLKSTMSTNPKGLHKQVNKKGQINVENALKFIKNNEGESKYELISKGFRDNLPKSMDYNEFRKIVQEQLIPLERQFLKTESNYGINKLGYLSPKRSSYDVSIQATKDAIVRGENVVEKQVHLKKLLNEYSQLPLENQTLILSNKSKFGRGSAEHGNPEETLGHIHFLRDAETPDIMTVTQIQSDAFQGTHNIMPKNLNKESATRSLASMDRHLEGQKKIYNEAKKLDGDTYALPNGNKINRNVYENMIKEQEEASKMFKVGIENFSQKKLLEKSHQERYLQELVAYAGSRGDINKMRLPTSETAAKVQGYKKRVTGASEDWGGPMSNRGKVFQDYIPEAKTILKKYSKQPKLIKKLFGVEPKIVTDSKGNTWYEFDIPENFKKGTGEIKAYKKGGNLPKAQTGFNFDDFPVIEYNQGESTTVAKPFNPAFAIPKVPQITLKNSLATKKALEGKPINYQPLIQKIAKVKADEAEIKKYANMLTQAADDYEYTRKTGYLPSQKATLGNLAWAGLEGLGMPFAAGVEAVKGITGNKGGADFMKVFPSGIRDQDLGLVGAISPEFEEAHPYWALAGDIAAGFATGAGYNKAVRGIKNIKALRTKGTKQVPDYGSHSLETGATNVEWRNRIPYNTKTGKSIQDEYVENLKKKYESPMWNKMMDENYPNVNKELFKERTLANASGIKLKKAEYSPYFDEFEGSPDWATGIYHPRPQPQYTTKYKTPLSEKVDAASSGLTVEQRLNPNSLIGHSFVKTPGPIKHEIAHQKWNSAEFLPEWLDDSFLNFNLKPEKRFAGFHGYKALDQTKKGENKFYHTKGQEYAVRQERLLEDLKANKIVDYFTEPVTLKHVEKLKDMKGAKVSSDSKDLFEWYPTKFIAETIKRGIPIVAGVSTTGALLNQQEGGSLPKYQKDGTINLTAMEAARIAEARARQAKDVERMAKRKEHKANLARKQALIDKKLALNLTNLASTISSPVVESTGMQLPPLTEAQKNALLTKVPQKATGSMTPLLKQHNAYPTRVIVPQKAISREQVQQSVKLPTLSEKIKSALVNPMSAAYQLFGNDFKHTPFMTGSIHGGDDLAGIINPAYWTDKSIEGTKDLAKGDFESAAWNYLAATPALGPLAKTAATVKTVRAGQNTKRLLSNAKGKVFNKGTKGEYKLAELDPALKQSQILLDPTKTNNLATKIIEGGKKTKDFKLVEQAAIKNAIIANQLKSRNTLQEVDNFIPTPNSKWLYNLGAKTPGGDPISLSPINIRGLNTEEIGIAKKLWGDRTYGGYQGTPYEEIPTRFSNPKLIVDKYKEYKKKYPDFTDKQLAFVIGQDPAILKQSASFQNVKHALDDPYGSESKRIYSGINPLEKQTKEVYAAKYKDDPLAPRTSNIDLLPEEGLVTSSTGLTPKEAFLQKRYQKGYDQDYNMAARGVDPQTDWGHVGSGWRLTDSGWEYGGQVAWGEVMKQSGDELNALIQKKKFLKPTKVFRNTRADHNVDIYNKSGELLRTGPMSSIKPGEHYIEKGFLSTTMPTRTHPQPGYVSGAKEAMLINIPGGGKQSLLHPNEFPSISTHVNELEALLPKGLKLEKIENMVKTGNPRFDAYDMASKWKILNPYIQAGLISTTAAKILLNQQPKQYKKGGNLPKDLKGTYTSSAKKLMEDNDLDPSYITASNENGRIYKRDVSKVLESLNNYGDGFPNALDYKKVGILPKNKIKYSKNTLIGPVGMPPYRWKSYKTPLFNHGGQIGNMSPCKGSKVSMKILDENDVLHPADSDNLSYRDKPVGFSMSISKTVKSPVQVIQYDDGGNIAKTEDEFKEGLNAGKNVFPFGHKGLKKMTSTPPSGDMEVPINIKGYTDNEQTDEQVMLPGEDVNVNGDTIVETPDLSSMDLNKAFDYANSKKFPIFMWKGNEYKLKKYLNKKQGGGLFSSKVTDHVKLNPGFSPDVK